MALIIQCMIMGKNQIFILHFLYGFYLDVVKQLVKFLFMELI